MRSCALPRGYGNHQVGAGLSSLILSSLSSPWPVVPAKVLLTPSVLYEHTLQIAHSNPNVAISAQYSHIIQQLSHWSLMIQTTKLFVILHLLSQRVKVNQCFQLCSETACLPPACSCYQETLYNNDFLGCLVLCCSELQAL